MSEELLADAFPKKQDIHTVEPVVEQQVENVVAPAGVQPGPSTITNITNNLNLAELLRHLKESDKTSSGSSMSFIKMKHVLTMIQCMMTAAFLYQQNPLSYFQSQKRGEGAVSGANARSHRSNFNYSEKSRPKGNQKQNKMNKDQKQNETNKDKKQTETNDDQKQNETRSIKNKIKRTTIKNKMKQTKTVICGIGIGVPLMTRLILIPFLKPFKRCLNPLNLVRL
jgi:hypothetical protein